MQNFCLPMYILW